jgi:hypothetical protein
MPTIVGMARACGSWGPRKLGRGRRRVTGCGGARALLPWADDAGGGGRQACWKWWSSQRWSWRCPGASWDSPSVARRHSATRVANQSRSRRTPTTSAPQSFGRDERRDGQARARLGIDGASGGISLCGREREDDSLRPHWPVANVAERVGFEPTVGFPLHTLSKRAPSASRPSLPSTRFARSERAHRNPLAQGEPHERSEQSSGGRRPRQRQTMKPFVAIPPKATGGAVLPLGEVPEP